MYYLLLSLAVALISAQVCFVKIYQLRAGTGIRVCLVFVLLTGAVSALVFACANGFHIAVSAFSLLLALPLALCVSFNNALGIRMLGRGDLATYTRFIMLGNMLLPFAYGALVLHESVGILRLAALGILVFSLFLPFLGSENARKRKGFDLVLYFLAFFAYGFVGVISKAHQIDARGVDAGSLLHLSVFRARRGGSPAPPAQGRGKTPSPHPIPPKDGDVRRVRRIFRGERTRVLVRTCGRGEGLRLPAIPPRHGRNNPLFRTPRQPALSRKTGRARLGGNRTRICGDSPVSLLNG